MIIYKSCHVLYKYDAKLVIIAKLLQVLFLIDFNVFEGTRLVNFRKFQALT